MTDYVHYHFAAHPHVGDWFQRLLDHVHRVQGPPQVTWRRTYVTIAAHPTIRAQRRGRRLVIVLDHRLDRHPLDRDAPVVDPCTLLDPDGLLAGQIRSLAGIRHQCPGTIEITVESDPHLQAAIGAWERSRAAHNGP